MRTARYRRVRYLVYLPYHPDYTYPQPKGPGTRYTYEDIMTDTCENMKTLPSHKLGWWVVNINGLGILCSDQKVTMDFWNGSPSETETNDIHCGLLGKVLGIGFGLCQCHCTVGMTFQPTFQYHCSSLSWSQLMKATSTHHIFLKLVKLLKYIWTS